MWWQEFNVGATHGQKKPADENHQRDSFRVFCCFFFKPMALELSHDILCRRAANDNRRSCRSHRDIFHHTYSLHNIIFSIKATATAAISCLFVNFVVQKIKKFVSIRVNSWFSLHLLLAFGFQLSEAFSCVSCVLWFLKNSCQFVSIRGSQIITHYSLLITHYSLLIRNSSSLFL